MVKVVTANMLATGTVVFLAADGSWVSGIGDAGTFDEADSAEIGLERAKEDAKRAIVVDPFVTDKGPDVDGRPKMALRDTIRAFGPTVDFRATVKGSRRGSIDVSIR